MKMVSTVSLFFMALSMLIAVGLPIAFFIVFRIRLKISYKAAVAGIVVFIVFTQILEKLMHWYLLVLNPATAAFLKQPVVYGLYGGLAAGVFEETGRFLAFLLVLKELRRWQDGLAYGLGHGGIESILLGGLGMFGNLTEAVMINTGAFDKMLASYQGQTLLQLEKVKSTLVGAAPALFAVTGLERAMALCVQVALSIFLLYGIKTKKYVFLLYAILIHAAVDFPAALYQVGKLSLWAVEGIVFVEAAAAVVWIILSFRLFARADQETAVAANG